jgi:hypothetical protein
MDEKEAALQRPPDGKSAGSVAYDASCARIVVMEAEKAHHDLYDIPGHPGNVGQGGDYQ